MRGREDGRVNARIAVIVLCKDIGATVFGPGVPQKSPLLSYVFAVGTVTTTAGGDPQYGVTFIRVSSARRGEFRRKFGDKEIAANWRRLHRLLAPEPRNQTVVNAGAYVQHRPIDGRGARGIFEDERCNWGRCGGHG